VVAASVHEFFQDPDTVQLLDDLLAVGVQPTPPPEATTRAVPCRWGARPS
jgi:DNA ligase (NAD+)